MSETSARKPWYTSQGNPWYVEVFVATGGWIAGILAAGAVFAFSLFILKGNEIGMATTSLLIGGAFAVFGCAVGQKRETSFARHFAIAMVVAGLTSASAGFGYLVFKFLGPMLGNGHGKAGFAGLITTAALSVVGFVFDRRVEDAILTFLLSLSVYALFTVSLMMFGAGSLGPEIALLTSAVFVLAGVGLYIRDPDDEFLPVAATAMMIGPLIFFIVVAGHRLFVTNLSEPYFLNYSVRAILLAALACSLWGLRTAVSFPALTSIAVLGAVLAILLPHYSLVALVIVSVGIGTGHRGLTTVGTLALGWSIGKFYYDLNLTLLTKSAIMAGVGLATLLTVFLLNSWKRGQISLAQSNNLAQPTRHGMSVIVMICVVFAASLYVVNSSVYQLEAGFKGARKIHLPLGPRDPRSLIQGDYMALRFDRAIYPKTTTIRNLPRDGAVFLKTNEEGRIQFSRIPKKGDLPGPNEIKVTYVKTSKQGLRYCPTTFFFQEGDAKLYQRARFAVVLVTVDGLTRLVDLADANKKTIVPSTN